MKEKKIYENPLRTPSDVKDFIAEGNPKIEFNDGLVLSNGDPEEKGDYAHFLLWLPKVFPENIRIYWEFEPLREPGLCMLFFAAKARNGQSIFDDSLEKRNGYYPQYHHGDINAYHLSYYRRKYATERCFQTANLRKSYGFHLVSQGADPLPNVEDVEKSYEMKVEKYQGRITFSINDLEIFQWQDEGEEGPVLDEGYIGFRQMAPMKARYSHLEVYELQED
ncbi:MAG TPA: YesU family protein [Candidatus Tetragenococcus pullicola]|nr:YesU family protein [Candidatus Tetragenococcus pullicola]